MAWDKKEPLKWVSGPNDNGRGSYTVHVCTFDGKQHCKTSSDITVAKEFAVLARQAVAVAAGGTSNEELAVDIPPYDGTVGWFMDVCGIVQQEMLVCTDLAKREMLRKDLSAISSASRTAKALIDQGKLEKRVAQMEETLKEVRAKRKHGAGTRGTLRSA